MREILFRGKRIDNGDWIEGYYVKTVDYRTDSAVHLIIELPSAFYPRGEIAREYEINSSTVGQFTGLTDKNGTRVFEGDIVKIVHKYQSPFDDDTKEYTDITTDVVFFDCEGLCFSYGKSPFLCVVDNVTAEYEVIGNIHDNPELLGEEKE